MSRRDELLARVVEAVSAPGGGELSLRQLAASAGTSHRMLLYHFGSKEQLLAEARAAALTRSRGAAARQLADERATVAAELGAALPRLPATRLTTVATVVSAARRGLAADLETTGDQVRVEAAHRELDGLVALLVAALRVSGVA